MSFGDLVLPAPPEEDIPTLPDVDAGGEDKEPENGGEESAPETGGEESAPETGDGESAPDSDGPEAYLAHGDGQTVDSKYAPWGTRGDGDDVAHVET